MAFDDWASQHPTEKKFLALFPAYTEATLDKPANDHAAERPSRNYRCMWRKRAFFSTARRARSI